MSEDSTPPGEPPRSVGEAATLSRVVRAPVSGTLPTAAAGSLEGEPTLTDMVTWPTVVMPSERYADHGLAGRGGMAEVHRVFDRQLQRFVAMKFIRSNLITQPRIRRRFLIEATITAGLAHPGIVAVHDNGELDDGRLWFSMQFVEGQTLFEASADSSREGPALRRLLAVFARVCQAVAYAHAAGVVHRDLKPQNIMLGPFGEVLVMDWGLARRLGRPLEPKGEAPPEGESWDTRFGDVLGTPGYMSPEQAMGRRDKVGRRSDVYALGAILYHLVAGRSPFHGNATAVLEQVVAGAWTPLSTGPEAIRAICRRAMSRDAKARYADAGAMAQAMSAWLDGEQARARAQVMVARAREALPRAAQLRAEAAAATAEASARLSPLPPHAPIEAKRPGWRLEDEAAAKLRAARLSEVEALQSLRAALTEAPDLREASSLLNAVYRERLLAAEGRHDTDGVLEYTALLEDHDAVANAEWLRGDGRFTVITDPPGAWVMIQRFEAQDRRLVPVEAKLKLPATPIIDHPLSMGSYLCLLGVPGRAWVRYPVQLDRCGRWDGVRPGATEPHPIPIPGERALGPDEVLMPAGWTLCGDDPDAPDGLSRRRIWIDDLVVMRHPVTHREYIEFLHDLAATGRAAEALQWTPLAHDRVSPAYERDADGRLTLRRVYEQDWTLDGPVCVVHWRAAMAYCAWYRARTGQPWRLLHSLEWEKAARGVDGRRFPWGDHFDVTWAQVMGHDADAPKLSPVGARPDDVSVYGIQGLAGNVRDLCIDSYTRDGDAIDGTALVVEIPDPASDALRMVKGGSFTSQASHCRAATRFALRPDLGILAVGFRLCRPVAPSTPPAAPG